MAARIGGAIVAQICGILLVWVIVASFGSEEVVVPTVNVAAKNATGTEKPASPAPSVGHAGAIGQASVNDILAARTRLMRDRTETGQKAFPPLAAGNFSIDTDLKSAPQPKDPQRWLANKPSENMLRERGKIKGISSLPYREAGSFQQPEGRDWRRLHNDQVRYGGGWMLFGTLFALAFFLLVRGRVRVDEGFSGEELTRFNAFERANHWMTATSFVLMGLTGLILIYGKPFLIALIGQPAFSGVAYWSAWLHMSFAIPFLLGILIMIALWLMQNLPTWVDWEWLKRGGGIIGHDHPPAYKFNAGQKAIFWIVTLGGLLMLASGLSLMFPFFWFGYLGMQSAQTVHAVVALCLIAVIFGHIYIGTVGMEGAFDAMWRGFVDRNWAKEHHSLWYKKIAGRYPDAERGERMTPAE